MDKELKEQKKLLEEQLERCRKQDSVLAEIENKLYEMKTLAKYAQNNNLKQLEINEMNFKMNELKKEVDLLVLQLQSNYP